MIDNRNEAVSTTGGNVVLDLGTILNQVANQVGVGGNLASKLPPDAAQLTIMKSDQLEEVQTGVRILRTLAWLLAALAIVLYARCHLPRRAHAGGRPCERSGSRSSRSAWRCCSPTGSPATTWSGR